MRFTMNQKLKERGWRGSSTLQRKKVELDVWFWSSEGASVHTLSNVTSEHPASMIGRWTEVPLLS